ncbi:MAG: hypothetical protein ACJ8IK_24810 [Burkholderiaceae bacterium]
MLDRYRRDFRHGRGEIVATGKAQGDGWPAPSSSRQEQVACAPCQQKTSIAITGCGSFFELIRELPQSPGLRDRRLGARQQHP